MKTIHYTPSAAHHNWAPYQIASVKCDGETPRTGFVGRSMAVKIGEIECVIMTKTDADLEKLGRALFDGNYNPDMIYKTTLIHSAGIEIVQPAVVEKPIPPVVPEVPAAPAKPGNVPARGDDGIPVVQYEKSAAAGEVANDHNAFEDLTGPTAGGTAGVADDNEL